MALSQRNADGLPRRRARAILVSSPHTRPRLPGDQSPRRQSRALSTAATPRSLRAAWIAYVKTSPEWKQAEECTRIRDGRIADAFLRQRVVETAPDTWGDIPIADLKRRHLKAIIAEHVRPPARGEAMADRHPQDDRRGAGRRMDRKRSGPPAEISAAANTRLARLDVAGDESIRGPMADRLDSTPLLRARALARAKAEGCCRACDREH